MTHRLRESKCPACGSRLDAASGLRGTAVPKPKPGDITLCIDCGQVMEFTATLGLRAIKDPARIPDISADNLRDIRRAQGAIATMKGN